MALERAEMLRLFPGNTDGTKDLLGCWALGQQEVTGRGGEGPEKWCQQVKGPVLLFEMQVAGWATNGLKYQEKKNRPSWKSWIYVSSTQWKKEWMSKCAHMKGTREETSSFCVTSLSCFNFQCYPMRQGDMGMCPALLHPHDLVIRVSALPPCSFEAGAT